MKRKKAPQIQKPKMLIVDDKAVNRYILKSIFEEHYEIVECQDGNAAIEALQIEALQMKALQKVHSQVAAVLLDIVMPVCDGFAVLKYMKETALYMIPVVLISSNVNDNNIHKACDYDVADYIQKPFQEDVVRQRVQRVIDLYQTRKENEEYEQAE